MNVKEKYVNPKKEFSPEYKERALLMEEASDPTTSLSRLEEIFFQTKHYVVKKIIASNPSIKGRIVDNIIATISSDYVAPLLRSGNMSVTAEQLIYVYEKHHPLSHKDTLLHPNFPLWYAEKQISNPKSLHTWYISKIPTLNEDFLNKIFDSDNLSMISGAVDHPNATLENIVNLAFDSSISQEELDAAEPSSWVGLDYVKERRKIIDYEEKLSTRERAREILLEDRRTEFSSYLEKHYDLDFESTAFNTEWLKHLLNWTE